MNKPEYFVENQTGGHNKHDKLSPAMSLLVIIGHVKDGIELAPAQQVPEISEHVLDAIICSHGMGSRYSSGTQGDHLCACPGVLLKEVRKQAPLGNTTAPDDAKS